VTARLKSGSPSARKVRRLLGRRKMNQSLAGKNAKRSATADDFAGVV
jgi:hypothetical protein